MFLRGNSRIRPKNKLSVFPCPIYDVAEKCFGTIKEYATDMRM
jgi:hypothetical protein